MCSLVLLAVVSTAPSFAQESTSTSSASSSAITKNPTIREQMKQKQEEVKTMYKEKIAQIKDQRKQAIITSLDQKIQTINTNQTQKMNSVLERLATYSGVIVQKAATAKAAGQNTGAVDTAVSTAQTAIAAAKEAVAAQSAKRYTITVESEATLRQTAGQTVSQFRADMQATHKLVVNAKQAVMKAAMELAKLRGVGASGSASESAQL